MSDESQPKPERYDPAAIEPAWQRYWEEHATFRAERHPGRRKLYILDMFPYPSGSGLHVGHPEGYTATDILVALLAHARRRRPSPHGLGRVRPARRAARHRDRHAPARDHDAQNIATFKRQLKMLGFSYDWSREIDTTDPGVREVDAVDLPQALREGARLPGRGPGELVPGARHGARERGGHRRQERARRAPRRAPAAAPVDAARSPRTPTGSTPISRALDWPGHAGRSSTSGSAAARAPRSTSPSTGTPATTIRVFTTRADTLPGVTYVVLAPEHPLVAELVTTPSSAPRSQAYVDAARQQERPRSHRRPRTKTGVAARARSR